jgi:RsiW-degrading membrane proteinase PrsW (M82 family)
LTILTSSSFLITYAVLQTVVLLLLIRFIDLYEHEPFAAIASMAVWGSVGATAFSYMGNGLLTPRLPPDLREAFGAAISAPVVEEVAKGVALVVAFAVSAWLHRRYGFNRLGGLTDGLVYGAAVGIGFAFTEDLYYLVDLGGSFSEFIARRDFFGVGALHHALYAAATGAGIGLAAWTRGALRRCLLGLAGLVVAMLLHATNNGAVAVFVAAAHGLGAAAELMRSGSTPSAVAAAAHNGAVLAALVTYGAFTAFGAATVYWLHRQRRVIRQELAAEVDAGLVDQRDVELASQYWARTLWYWQLTRIGELDRARLLRRLHIQLANLALLKRRSRADQQLADAVDTMRQRVATLKAGYAVDVYAAR